MGYREKTEVHHWHYEDGWRYIYPSVNIEDGETREFYEEMRGWHCWVYPHNDRDFEEWMDANIKGKYDYTHRFNSGDPMYTVNISNNEDALLFKLKWM